MNHKENNPKTRRKITITILLLFILVSIGIAFSFQLKTKGLEDNPPQDQASSDEEIFEPVLLTFNDYMKPVEANYNLYYTPPKVKGIYLTSNTAGISSRLDSLIKLVNDTELNAMVIDVKTDDGVIAFDSQIPLAIESEANTTNIDNIEDVVGKLVENDIYPIARVVAFKDNHLPRSLPLEYGIKKKNAQPITENMTEEQKINTARNNLWIYKNMAWLNPYNKKTWDYLVDIGKEAARVGFKEIQFDYIRFEATSNLQYADLGPESETKSRIEIITEFTKYATEQLKPYGVVVSADVFGSPITSEVDSRNLGQDYVLMSQELDVICPMIYPSHYGTGSFGFAVPDKEPYGIVKAAMDASEERLSEIANKEDKPIVRPWLQAFTASYLKTGTWKHYTGDDIRAQIQAAYDAGLEEWILWNAGNSYTAEGLLNQ